MKPLIAGLLLLGMHSVAFAQSTPRAGVDWPGFRGIAARGVDDGKALPVEWSVPDKKLVKWRVPVAGLGHSSPVVWGDHVCTASAISGTPDPQLKVGLYGDIGSVLDQTEHKFIVACFDKRTGKQRWERVAKAGVPIIKRHPKSTHASSTLATDGRHVVAMFGSEGL
jgi:outer membrane protein assembly factor BamB